MTRGCRQPTAGRIFARPILGSQFCRYNSQCSSGHYSQYIESIVHVVIAEITAYRKTHETGLQHSSISVSPYQVQLTPRSLDQPSCVHSRNKEEVDKQRQAGKSVTTQDLKPDAMGGM
jgi:hypothetical protein